ncbi:MAG: monovalent cation/H(+) antiporter subunit G [Pseudomonadota bacterium]
MDVLLSVLLISSGAFALLGSVGLLRLPDVLIRMHASTKIGTLACGLVMAAAALHFGTSDSVIRALAIILFLFLTAPIGAHMIGRAAVSSGVPLWNTRMDTERETSTDMDEA